MSLEGFHSTTEKGRRLEQIVAAMERFLSPTRTVKRNAPVWDHIALIDRDFDVTVHETKAGRLLAVIECKNQKRAIDVDVLDSLRSKADDCRVSNVSIVSSSGYTPAALRKATVHGIFPFVFVQDDDALAIPEWFLPRHVQRLTGTYAIESAVFILSDGSRPRINGVDIGKTIVRTRSKKKYSLKDLAETVAATRSQKTDADVLKYTFDKPLYFNESIEFPAEENAKVIGMSRAPRLQRASIRLRYWIEHSREALRANSLQTLGGEERALAVVTEPFRAGTGFTRIALMFRKVENGHELHIDIMHD